MAKLAAPLGNEIGWVKKLGGEPAAGDKLDFVAIDIRHGSADRTSVMVSGAATDDPNCVVLERQAGSDIFAHRYISPEGSGGAPIFDAATGTLVGIVGETDPQTRVALAYRADEVPKLIGKLAPATDVLYGTWTGDGDPTTPRSAAAVRSPRSPIPAARPSSRSASPTGLRRRRHDRRQAQRWQARLELVGRRRHRRDRRA